MSELYKHNWTSPDGKTHSMDDYRDEVVLIVNTASKCGLTPQYEGLEKIHQQYKDKGLKIIGFPCNQFLSQEPGSDDEIAEFCSLNYGVSFPLSTKIEVNGKNTDPLFKYLKERAPGILGSKKIKWNFNKFLISRGGDEVLRFSPKTAPKELVPAIEKMLGNSE